MVVNDQLKTDQERRLSQVQKDEAALRFREFTYDDAARLAFLIYRRAESEGKAVCWEITVDGFPAARGFMEGTGEENLVWLDRKRRTVQKSGKSSLRCGLEAEVLGTAEPWYEDTEHYVIRGGGFPIRTAGGELRGAACVSGLAHTEDHDMVTEAVREYLAAHTKEVDI